MLRIETCWSPTVAQSRLNDKVVKSQEQADGLGKMSFWEVVMVSPSEQTCCELSLGKMSLRDLPVWCTQRLVVTRDNRC